MVVARDPTNDRHVVEATETTYMLNAGSEFAKTWSVAYSKFVEDLLTQDNGAFLEVIGDGFADGPIEGAPIAVRHLDSFRCTRTANPEFPVVYLAEDDKRYKIHWSRVIMMAQMPSPRREMHGVGLCAVSRACYIAQNLLDIIVYKQEQLGSRPPNLLLIGQGITGKQIMEAFRSMKEETSNVGLSRYSKIVAIGSENPDINIEKLDLKSMEPFDEETSITLGMFAIAGAFGMDASEIWPTSGGSASKADSALKRLRSRGKLPAQTTSDLAMQFNMKVVPPYLEVKFDFKDDEEDQQRALIRDIRGRNRERDLGTGVVDERTARQNMLNDGDLGRKDFELMELDDGRLPDGTNVGVLFFSADPLYRRHLATDNGADLLLVDSNEIEESVIDIQLRRNGAFKELAATTSTGKRDKLKITLSTLDWLENQYHERHLRALPDVPLQNRRASSQITRLTTVNIDGDAPDAEERAADFEIDENEEVPVTEEQEVTETNG